MVVESRTRYRLGRVVSMTVVTVPGNPGSLNRAVNDGNGHGVGDESTSSWMDGDSKGRGFVQ